MARLIVLFSFSFIFSDFVFGNEVSEIKQLMKRQFDTPDTQLVVDPVVVQGNYSIVSWIQGDAGGRALLTKKESGWTILLCSGSGLTEVQTLKTAGVSEDVAKLLIKKVNNEESKLSENRRKKFSLFKGDLYQHH